MEEKQMSAWGEKQTAIITRGDSVVLFWMPHALPKTILRRGRKPAGAMLGVANMLLRLCRDEQLEESSEPRLVPKSSWRIT
jgi:hypothetical protein